jgi:[ribosomal protein S5]-alanine N-acetyltransferase
MLETPRLILRPATLEDAQNLFNLNNDPEVTKFTGDYSFKSPLDAHHFISERLITQFEQYKMGRFIVLSKDAIFHGWCGLSYDPTQNETDLGFRFFKNSWGQGHATEASKACLEYGFGKLGLLKIVARAMPENTASIKVMQKLGMTFRGYYNNPSDAHHFVLYDITKSEFNRCADS